MKPRARAQPVPGEALPVDSAHPRHDPFQWMNDGPTGPNQRTIHRSRSPAEPLEYGWGATIVRVYQHTVRLRLNTEMSTAVFSVSRACVDTVATLRKGDQLLIRFQQLPERRNWVSGIKDKSRSRK